jgi:hypothetical protein
MSLWSLLLLVVQDQAPDVMRSCSMALSLLSTAVGSYLAGALTLVVQEFSEDVTGKQWLPNDLNQVVHRGVGAMSLISVSIIHVSTQSFKDLLCSIKWIFIAP